MRNQMKFINLSLQYASSNTLGAAIWTTTQRRCRMGKYLIMIRLGDSCYNRTAY